MSGRSPPRAPALSADVARSRELAFKFGQLWALDQRAGQLNPTNPELFGFYRLPAQRFVGFPMA